MSEPLWISEDVALGFDFRNMTVPTDKYVVAANKIVMVNKGASHFRKFVVRASCSLVVHVSKMLTLLIVFLQNWDAPVE